MDPRATQALAALALLTLLQCNDDVRECTLGEMACACNQGQCLSGLQCSGGMCVSESGSESESGSSSGSTSEESTAVDSSASDDPATTEMTETGTPCVAPSIMCDGECVDPSTDANNCGECGMSCASALESGGCVDGMCIPVWSGCLNATSLVLCPEVCQSQGYLGCATSSCSGLSVLWFSSMAECEVGEPSNQGEATPCEVEPTGMNSLFYRCCCDQN